MISLNMQACMPHYQEMHVFSYFEALHVFIYTFSLYILTCFRSNVRDII